MTYKELDLWQVILILRKRLIVILISMLFCGALFYLFSFFLIAPKYTATASMYVFSNTNRSENAITSSELTASQELVNTYIVVLKSDTVLNQVIEKLDLSMTPEEVRTMVNAGSIGGTEAFNISVTSNDPVLSQRIVNTIVQIAPVEIIRVVKAGGAEVIDYAKVPDKPVSPNILLNTVIGVLVGFVLSFGVSLALVIFNTKFHSEEDLAQIFSIPVLGSVPTLIEQK